jgi:hypothetical protein
LEAGTSFSWSSAISISLLVVSAVMWVLFVINERRVSDEKRRAEPIFPWRFFFSRAWMGTLMYVYDRHRASRGTHMGLIGFLFSQASHTILLSLRFPNGFKRCTIHHLWELVFVCYLSTLSLRLQPLL